MSADPQRLQSPEDVLHAALPAALEVITAWTTADEETDPAMFSAALDRVITDAVGDPNPQQACAQLLFGMASLSGILAADLAAATGQTRAQILNHVHQRYIAAADRHA